jgi:NAD(P)H-hydrate epimerase
MDAVLSVAEMQRVDANAADRADALMDAAGFSVAMSAAAMDAAYGTDVHVLAGRGNNGGDGYVAARYLARRGASVTVHHNGIPEPDTVAGRAMRAAQASGIRMRPMGDVVDGDLIIDALYGTGFRGELPEVAIPWTVTDIPVLSVDIPSGVSGDSGLAAGSAFRAQRTATFHMLKTGHLLGDGPGRCGTIDLYDIGLRGGNPEMWRFTDADVVTCLRPRTAHKWSAGAVATVGGAPGLTGAALLCARAAIASGSGVSSILTTAGTAQAYETMAPDIVSILAHDSDSWNNGAQAVLSQVGRFQSLVVGPGLDPANARFVEELADGFPGTLIIDAGALNAMENVDVLARRTAGTVLTPHAGEFKRLTGSVPSTETVKNLAERSGAVVVAKGNPTIVAGGGRVVIVDSGGPELATIGTGDVLAGMIGAFTACGVPMMDAATSAAHLHGVAGRTLAAKETVSAPALVWEVGATLANITSIVVDPREG